MKLINEDLNESIHELNSIKIPGYMNTWSSIDVYDVTVAPYRSKRYFLMENDKYGDETQYLVVSEDLSEIYETYDDIETALRDEGILESLNEAVGSTKKYLIVDHFDPDYIYQIKNIPEDSSLWDSDYIIEDVSDIHGDYIVEWNDELIDIYPMGGKTVNQLDKEIFDDISKYIKENPDDLYYEEGDKFPLSISISIKDFLKDPDGYKHVLKDTLDYSYVDGDSSSAYAVMNLDDDNFEEYSESIFGNENLDESIIKTSKNKWVNKGKKGTYGEFSTKKKAREQQIRESLSNDELNNMIAIAHKIGLNTLEDLKDFLKRESNPNETVIDTLNRYSKEFDSNESLKEDINMDSTTVDKSKIKFNINDNGDFTFTIDGKEYKGHTDKPQDMSKNLKNFGFDLTEDFNLENGPKTKDIGIAQLLIDAINGEWDTIKLYNDIMVNLESYGYKDISDVIKDIVVEENVHIGQLQKALETISPNVNSIEDGSKEAEGQLTDTTEANELNNYEEDK